MQSEFFQHSAKVLTVAELTRAIRGTLETKFGAVWVQGEISNHKLHPSGHQYFTLKDHRAQIACVIFRNTLPPFPRPLADGAQVQVFGNISVFEGRGQYQLSVQILQPRGVGLLQAKFEALKRKLEAEGLFASERKRPLPRYPRRIGIVTSASGAAVRDMLNVLQRRAPAVEILINPVRVQGIGAAAEIAVAIRELAGMDAAQLCKLRSGGSQVENLRHESGAAVDVIVLTRGGGSIEDLWEFNEEIVARAMHDSPVPVVSAVGHEVDFTIADFVADLRAPTPSAAAELIVTDAADLLRRVHELAACVDKNLRNSLVQVQTRLRFLSEKTLGRELLQRLRDGRQTIDLARESLRRTMTRALTDRGTSVERLSYLVFAHVPTNAISSGHDRIARALRQLASTPERHLAKAHHSVRRVNDVLRVLGPDATLRRGYSITTDDTGRIIQTVSIAPAGQRILTRVADGTFASQVLE